MDYYIGICPAPCLLQAETLSAHEENVRRMERFLKGEYGEVLESLHAEMTKHSKALRFEEAQKIKERLESLSLLAERQIARNEVKEEADALVIIERNGRDYVGFCRIRATELRSLERHGTENPLSENESVAGVRFLSNLYADGIDFPKILLLERSLEDTEFEAFLSESGIAIEYPQIGPKAELLRFLKTNVAEYALKDGMEKIAARAGNRGTMVSILKGIGFEANVPPLLKTKEFA